MPVVQKLLFILFEKDQSSRKIFRVLSLFLTLFIYMSNLYLEE